MADNYSGYANAGGWAGAGEGITQAATMLLGNNMETYRQEKLLKLRGDQAKGLQAERIAAEEGLLGTKLASQEGEGQLDRESAERIAAMRADSAKASKGWDAVPFTDADGNTTQRLYNKDLGVWKDEGTQPNMSIEQASTFAEKEAEAMDRWYKGDESIYGEGNTRESWTTNRILQLTGQKEGQATPTDYSNLWGDAPAEKKSEAAPAIDSAADEGLIAQPKTTNTRQEARSRSKVISDLKGYAAKRPANVRARSSRSGEFKTKVDNAAATVSNALKSGDISNVDAESIRLALNNSDFIKGLSEKDANALITWLKEQER